jgi:D-beta-D-heptose 7-phosphate kinase/D-beta-D-heptose 1-phosphate adenosyltransferase
MLTYLDLLPHRRVAVIGDLMLDCYLYGGVHRISPEAPVPVIRASSERLVAGGAANVTANLATLGLEVAVVGLCGRDAAHDELIACMAAHGPIDTAGVVASPRRRTTRKMRVIGAHQQILRIDHEDTAACDADEERQLLAAVARAVAAADVVIVSDYGKGVCTDAVLSATMAAAKAAGKAVLVDPKRLDYAAYRGATVITPNRKELTEATGLPCETDAEAEAAAARARALSGADILLTRSERGMSYFPAEGRPLHLATVAQEVFDVSGAGDTVIAVLAAGLAAELPVADAMRLANYAAGVVVSKLGTATVTREELAIALSAAQAPVAQEDGLRVTRDEAVALRWAWARDKLTVGFANGCFDILHPGHISLIRQAAESCDRLIVALNADASVRRLKGPERPVQNEAARAAVMGAIRGVAAVVVFDEDTPLDLIAALQPDVLIKGADYSEDQVVGADIVRARGGRILLAELTAGQSTTKLIARTRPAALAGHG